MKTEPLRTQDRAPLGRTDLGRAELRRAEAEKVAESIAEDPKPSSKVEVQKKPESEAGGSVGKMGSFFTALKSRKSVRHLIRAFARFTERLGAQFAAAITYFSFLAIVPILMLAFSVAGFVLNRRPDLLQQLQDKIAGQIPGGLKDTIQGALTTAVNDRYSVGIIGLVIALYSGIGWMGNVRQAIQAQWRPDFDDDQEIANESLLVNLGKNLVMLMGLGLALVLSLALSSIGGALSNIFLKLLGLADISWLHPLVVVISLLLAVGADVLIFLWVYSVLPPAGMKGTRSALVRGSIMAAVIFEILKLALTKVPKLLSGGAAGAVFGNIIGLLAFFNLAATVVLFVAAWISTAQGGPRKKVDDKFDHAEVPAPAVVVHEVVSRGKIAGLIGVGAVLGLGWSHRRR